MKTATKCPTPVIKSIEPTNKKIWNAAVKRAAKAWLNHEAALSEVDERNQMAITNEALRQYADNQLFVFNCIVKKVKGLRTRRAFFNAVDEIATK